jgi:hypothetical protein
MTITTYEKDHPPALAASTAIAGGRQAVAERNHCAYFLEWPMHSSLPTDGKYERRWASTSTRGQL